MPGRRADRASQRPLAKPERAWNDPQVRARAIANWAPFKAWPKAALLRLAHAATVSTHPAGTILVEYDRPMQVLLFVLDGATQVTIADPHGRNVTFLYDASTLVYGLAPLLDDGEMMHELVAIDAVTAMTVSFDVLRAELDAAPGLWQSLAVEMCARYRRVSAQMTRFLFDTPRVHMASLLLSLLDDEQRAAADGRAVHIHVRLPQGRLAEMLAISRQWTSQLIQEMSRDGLLRWRYGRVTLLDLERLRTIAGGSISPRQR